MYDRGVSPVTLLKALWNVRTSPNPASDTRISPGLVRISVGITGTLEQRLEQLDDAIEATLR